MEQEKGKKRFEHGEINVTTSDEFRYLIEEKTKNNLTILSAEQINDSQNDLGQIQYRVLIKNDKTGSLYMRTLSSSQLNLLSKSRTCFPGTPTQKRHSFKKRQLATRRFLRKYASLRSRHISSGGFQRPPKSEGKGKGKGNGR